MSVPANTATQLPAHLLNFGSAASIGLNAVGGIQSGKAHPRISIKQNRFRLIDEQGQETVVAQLYLDIIIVGANPFVSKIFYKGAYNPNAGEMEAPTCWSDNGTGPSVRASEPQSPTCVGCQNNAWGSKVTPAGTKIKACSDSKKMAVLLADNPGGSVYELRVPGASLENIKAIGDMLNERKMPLPGVVIRVSFDETSDYPKLLFAAINYISEGQKAAVLEVFDGEEVKEAIGSDDTVRTAAIPLAAPVQAAPVVYAASALPLAPQFNPAPPPSPIPFPQGQQAQQAAPTVRRRRRAAEPDQAVQAAPMAMPAAPMPAPPAFVPPAPAPVAQPTALEIPPFLKRQDIPNAVPAAASVPMAPQQTDAALDALLNQAMQR